MTQRIARLLVFVLPFATSLGAIARLGPLALARVVAVGLIACAVVAVVRRRELPKVALWVLAFTVVWIGWGFLRLTVMDGFRELLSVGIGLLLMAALVCLAAGQTPRTGATADRPAASQTSSPPGEARSWLRTFTRGWMVAWFTTCVPAVWEIVTGNHLSNYMEGSSPYVRSVSKDAASYMVNPNLFAFLLTTAMGMLMVGWIIEKGAIRWVYAAMVVASPFICWFTNSRLATLITPLFLVWFIMQMRWFRAVAKVGAVALLAVLVAAIPLVALMRQGVPATRTGSIVQRESLYNNGWYMIWSTLGVGVGPGRFEYWVTTALAPFDRLGGPANPHSGLFETASQYGVVIAAIGLALYAVLLLLSWPVMQRRWADPTWSRLRWTMLVLTLTSLPLSFANSSWLDSSVAFAQLAGFALIAHLLIEEGASPLPRWQGAVGSVALPRHRRLLRRAQRARSAGHLETTGV